MPVRLRRASSLRRSGEVTARERQRLGQVAVAAQPATGPPGVDLDHEVTGEVPRGEVLEELGDRLPASSGDEVLVLGAPRAVGEVQVAQGAVEPARQVETVDLRGRGVRDV